MISTIYKFSIPNEVVPKARPRFHNKVAYLPKRYRDWKESAIIELKLQYNLEHPLQKASIKIDFVGINKRGDLDNLAGSILDALVEAKVIEDDRIAIIPSLSVCYWEGKVKETAIEITSLE